MFPTRRDFLILSCGLVLSRFSRWYFSPQPSGDDLPEKRICKISDLAVGQPLRFSYLHEDLGEHFIVKLGVEAPGGITDSKDVVAYNAMSLEIPPYIHGEHHLVSGRTTVQLPQVRLKLKGQQIYAAGFLTPA